MLPCHVGWAHVQVFRGPQYRLGDGCIRPRACQQNEGCSQLRACLDCRCALKIYDVSLELHCCVWEFSEHAPRGITCDCVSWQSLHPHRTFRGTALE